MKPLFYDEFNIDEQYHELKKLITLLEKDIYKFISPSKNKEAALRARKKLREIKKVAGNLRMDISKQRHHNSSEY